MITWRISLGPSAVLLLLASLFIGCTEELGTCPAVAGKFQATYQIRSGTCGDVGATNMVPFDNNTTIDKFANIEVETRTILRGCTAWMEQTVRNKVTTLLEQRIQGSTIGVEDSDKLTGMVTFTRWDAAGQVMCSGEYNAVFTKMPLLVGGAAM